MPVELSTSGPPPLEFSSNVFSQHDLGPERDIADKCAVFGIYDGGGADVAEATAMGLFALQHRGQESSGVTSSDGDTIFDHRRGGLVAQIYDETVFDFASLPGPIALGHNRYGTSSRKLGPDAHIQPIISGDRSFSLAHNGNIPDTTALETFLDSKGIRNPQDNDTEMMHAAVAYYVSRGASLEDGLREAAPLFTGAYSLLAMDNERLIALRDPKGIRPLSIGRYNGAYVFSSETTGLDIIGAGNLRDVRPGEMVIVDQGGFRSEQIAPGEQRLDIFEYVYFAHPGSNLLERNVSVVRGRFGEILAQEHPADADLVVPVPLTAEPAAIGFHDASGIPLKQGIVKNRYVGRTFITPGEKQRSNAINQKLHAIPEVVGGQRVVVVDDSIVRGATSRNIVRMLREAGAREVHMRITSPPIYYPDFYGIDTPRQESLLASKRSIEEMRQFINADSLGYLSLEGMMRAVGVPEGMLSTSSFTGEYPVDIGRRREEVVFDPSWQRS